MCAVGKARQGRFVIRKPAGRPVFDAPLAAIDATDDERASSVMGVVLHVVPASRVPLGGTIVSAVCIDVVLPGIALASLRRRRFIADATAAVAALASDSQIAARTDCRDLEYLCA